VKHLNIFYLHSDPKVAAQMQTNKHVVKMILESAQLLCTAHRVADGEHYIDASSGRRLQRWRHSTNETELYQATHFNHPCAIWARESKANYNWLYSHFMHLSQEYKERYGKVHASWAKLNHILFFSPVNVPNKDFTEPALAMLPEYIRRGDPVGSYRAYYEAEKLKEPQDIERYYTILKAHEAAEEYK
jgi:hypothetical protein